MPLLNKGWVRHFLLIVLIVYWLAEFISTHIPQEKVPSLGTSDTVCHCEAFFILSSLFWLTLTSRCAPMLKKLIVIITILPIYAALDELTQPIVNRHASISDWLADVVGVVLAMAVCEIIAAIIRRLRRAQ